MEVLNPAAEFDYSPRVRELFTHLQHAGTLSVTPKVLSVSAGSRQQGVCVRLFIEVRDARMKTIRFQAYGCPHFLAACESLAQWLEGRAVKELSHWRWREAEAELVVPASKRSRLLVLEEAVTQLVGLAGD